MNLNAQSSNTCQYYGEPRIDRQFPSKKNIYNSNAVKIHFISSRKRHLPRIPKYSSFENIHALKKTSEARQFPEVEQIIWPRRDVIKAADPKPSLKTLFNIVEDRFKKLLNFNVCVV